MMRTVIEKKPVAVGIPEIGPPESDWHFITCNFCLGQRRSWAFFRVVLRRLDGSGVSGSVNSIPDSETLICNLTSPCYLTLIDSQYGEKVTFFTENRNRLFLHVTILIQTLRLTCVSD